MRLKAARNICVKPPNRRFQFYYPVYPTSYGDLVDSQLSPTDQAIAHAFIKMIDENLYWVLVHARWGLANNIAALNQLFFAGMPFPMNKIIASIARKDVLSKLQKQGMGRHSDVEVTAIGNRDLQALSTFLDSKTFFFGEKPSSLDAVAYAILVQLLHIPCAYRADFRAS